MSQRDLSRTPAQHDSSRRNLLLRGMATLGALLFSKLGLASASAATPTPAGSVHAAAEGTLLIFGDSLSAGYGLKPGEEWPALLQHRLSTQGSRIRISNASISGESTGGGLARFPAALAAAKPKWVILELGANDGLRGYPVKTMRDNLVTMVKLSQQAGARVMIIGMYIPPNYGKPYTEAFAKQFRDIADEYKLVFEPFLLEPVILKEGMLLPDRLHPTAAGQPLLLDWLWPKIKTLIESD